jgi:GNAT superfamily N-acetyltransferase
MHASCCVLNGPAELTYVETEFGAVDMWVAPDLAKETRLIEQIVIRPFVESDAAPVRELFIKVNELLAPPDLKGDFERYIARSLTEEVDRIADYYGERGGGFWVAVEASHIVGMFGLEPSNIAGAMELRRMYVDVEVRGRGIARKMLAFAEAECRGRGISELELSTSELQVEALSLYRNFGYRQIREEIAAGASNKTIGGGIRRFHFTKRL